MLAMFSGCRIALSSLSLCSFWIFVKSPISLTCLALALLLLGSAILPVLRARRERIALETAS